MTVAKHETWMLGAVLAGLTVLSAPAQAATELVVNGGFETDSFDGWIGTGDADFNGVLCDQGASAHSGACSAFFGSLSDSGLTQVIDVGGAGLTYNLSFALQADGSTPSSFSVSFGGQTLLSLSDPALAPYTVYQFSGLTTGADMTLAFNFSSPVGYLYLDSVSVTAVPEPATLALMAGGLLVTGAAARRRAKRA